MLTDMIIQSTPFVPEKNRNMVIKDLHFRFEYFIINLLKKEGLL